MPLTVQKKICLLGDIAVGKTSLVRRFVYDLFDERYLSTIGVKVSRKTQFIPRANGIVEVHMMLWDLVGSQRFSRLRSSYLRGAAGAVLVCDLTRPKTLDSLSSYVDDLRTISPGSQLIVAANKSDLTAQQRLTQGQIEQAADRLGAPFYLTSAKTGDRVPDLFRCLAELLV
jgi:small GTP-binding protein